MNRYPAILLSMLLAASLGGCAAFQAKVAKLAGDEIKVTDATVIAGCKAATDAVNAATDAIPYWTAVDIGQANGLMLALDRPCNQDTIKRSAVGAKQDL